MQTCPSNSEIVHALKQCADLSAGCRGCPFNENDSGCTSKLMALAADRLAAVSAELEGEKKCLDFAHETIKMQQREIAKLTEMVDWDDE